MLYSEINAVSSLIHTLWINVFFHELIPNSFFLHVINNRWVFLTETGCVYCAVRSAHTVYLCVLCGSENKQRLFHCTALKYRIL
jgi:hypothetical protein